MQIKENSPEKKTADRHESAVFFVRREERREQKRRICEQVHTLVNDVTPTSENKRNGMVL